MKFLKSFKNKKFLKIIKMRIQRLAQSKKLKIKKEEKNLSS